MKRAMEQTKVNQAGFTPFEPGRSKRLKPRLRRSGSQTGFTLIELILAMTFFAFMLTLLSIGVLQIMKLYQADLSTRRTQQAARLVMEDLTRSIRSATSLREGGDHLCVSTATGTILYKFTAGAGTLIKYPDAKIENNQCVPGPTSQALLDPAPPSYLEARAFSANLIKATDTNPAVFQSVGLSLSVGLQAAGSSQITSGNVCTAGPGNEFCSVTTYTNTVSLR